VDFARHDCLYDEFYCQHNECINNESIYNFIMNNLQVPPKKVSIIQHCLQACSAAAHPIGATTLKNNIAYF